MLAIPIRFVRNVLGLIGRALEWIVLWPFVLLRRRRRLFVEVRIKRGFRLAGRQGLLGALFPGPSYEGLCRTLDRVERTSGVEGVLVRPGETLGSATDAELIRDRLNRLRRAGKRVVCYVDAASATALIIASAADTVIMAPAGRLFWTGLKADLTFVRDLLTRLGLRGQFIHIGRYKTAGHMFARSQSSKAQRSMTRALLNDLSETVEALITRNPEGAADGTPGGMPLARLEGPTLTFSQARRAGLAHERAYPDQLKTALRADRAGDDFDVFGTYASPERAREHAERLKQLPPVSLLPSSRLQRLRPKPMSFIPLVRSRPVLAVVEMSGIIIPDEADMGPLSGRPHIAPELVRKVFKRLRQDRRVKAVVLAIDSRGGSALASDLIWREVRRLQHERPVIAALRSVAASGGYYIAVGANEIVAAPTALTGSIGVVAGKLSGETALGKADIGVETMATSPWATLFSLRHAWTERQVGALREDIRASYRRFVQRVAAGRDMPMERVHLLARGRVYTGRQALKRKLVDGLGTLEDALDRAAERAGIERARARIDYHALFSPSLRSLLTSGLTADVVPQWAYGLEPGLADALDLVYALRADPVLAWFDGAVSFDGR